MMKLSQLALVSILLAATTSPADGQQEDDCSGQGNRFPGTSTRQCLPWGGQEGELKKYPEDFAGILNEVKIYRCPVSKKRVIVSNAIPDHNLIVQNREGACEMPYAIEMPLDPVFDVNDARSEVPIRGMIAVAKNGVPVYGPKESDGWNAVDVDPTETNKLGASFWYGHKGIQGGWHIHSPHMGTERITSSTFLGYSMDGFEIYGPLNDNIEVEKLDDCNGYLSNDGSYRYHVRTKTQVDSSLPYCVGGVGSGDPRVNWKYVLGCYSGTIADTSVNEAATYTLPDDCVEDYYAGSVGPGDGADDDFIHMSVPTIDDIDRPNIIIMQPDDLPHLDEWAPPPNNPDTPNSENKIPPAGMPNIENLRNKGLQMMQAYAASPVCGTSRFSTITGKMPSRAFTVQDQFDSQPSKVTIPTTKLDGVDCSAENLAAALQGEYATAMFGKWHLTRFDKTTYTYSSAAEEIKDCGFDVVDGLYIENFVREGQTGNGFHDGDFSHNMEWITHEAIKFINETTSAPNPKPFFMYFNPTVPHGNQDVKKALEDFTCKQTADGVKDEPWIKHMSEDEGCKVYRNTVIDRANGDDRALGKIWIDDAVGALVHALKDRNVFENTIFLFQEDHGMDAKGSLYENGLRIPQFVHYPAQIKPGTKLDVPVSTVDIAATMLDYAGIPPTYRMDGKSWKGVIGNSVREDFWKSERCLFFEINYDRAVRCGCYKYLDIENNLGDTWIRGDEKNLDNELGGMLFDLCDVNGDYVTDNNDNRERKTRDNVINNNKLNEFSGYLDCYLTNTDPGKAASFSACGPEDPNEPDIPEPVTPPEGECADDEAFRFNNNPDQGCSWAKLDRGGRCNRDNVREKCPLACGVCQENPNTPPEGDNPNTPPEGDNPNTPPEGDNPNTPPEGDNPPTPPEGDNPNTPPEGDNPNTPPEGDNPPSPNFCENSSDTFDLGNGKGNESTCKDIAKMAPRDMKVACRKDIAMEKCPSICNRRKCKCVNYDGRIDEGRNGKFKFCDDLKDTKVSVVTQDNYCRGTNRLLCPKYCQENCRRDETSSR